MSHRTAQPSTAAVEPPPPDLAAMRTAVRRLLDEDTEPPAPEELAALALQLREHITRAMPAVTRAAGRLPKTAAARACALACVGEAERKLRIGNGDTPAVRLAVAQKLARSARALADHYDNLGSQQ